VEVPAKKLQTKSIKNKLWLLLVGGLS